MRAVWIVLICLGALALILLLASYIVMRYACRRGHALGTDLDKELRHSSFRHYKDDIVRAQQWLKEQPVQEVFVTSYDGLRLRARYIPCENARATLLLFHGWRSYPELDFGAALTFYQSFGVNILLPDERAQGESEGKFITFGVRERHGAGNDGVLALHIAQLGGGVVDRIAVFSLRPAAAHTGGEQQRKNEKREQERLSSSHVSPSLRTAGSRTVKQVPPPARALTAMLPPRRRTVSATMESPRPVPPAARERILSTR